MGNTGYKSFASLELYYTDDNSYAGATKANVVTDPDYIAPVLDTVTCVPSARYYNTVRTMDATKNGCSSGYSGSSVTLTANANQFVSAISVADANALADSWLATNVQTYANTSGTCAPLITYPYCEGTTRWYSPTSFQYDSLVCGGNGFGGTCVIEGTEITMFNGTTKKVEDLVLGDKLRSKAVAGLKDNEENNETWRSESLTLTDCEVEVVKCEPSEVQLLNSINEGLLKISDSHIHLVKKDAEWRLLRTYELSIGDFMVDEFGNEVEITSIGLLNGGFTIYDLGVEENDLYIANGILTHNK
jgi:hypothetical protein